MMEVVYACAHITSIMEVMCVVCRAHRQKGADMPVVASQGAATARSDDATAPLLRCGLIAGPLFLLASLLQGFAREGFDLRRQPLSFLSLGTLGWLQIANFLLAGILTLLFAAGVRQQLRGRAGGTFGPLGFIGLGLGLIIAGLFPPDPGFGYPLGTPDGPPAHTTYHSSMHGLGFMLAFLFFVLAALIFARVDAGRGQWLSVGYTLVSAVAALVLAMMPGIQGIALRDLAAAALLWTWVAVQAWRLTP